MVDVSYYNLSGGVNQALSKTELGADTKKIYWTDSENIEIYKNRGLIKQAGNQKYLELPLSEEITGIKEMSAKSSLKLVITTVSGRIYVYNNATTTLTLLSKTLNGQYPQFEKFLNGLLVITESDGLFYIKDNLTYDVVDCNLKDDNENYITNGVLAVYGGRVWVGVKSTIYYSALGTYDDFTMTDDAGYIRDFYTNTDNIVALKPYKDYLAIYKENMVYLLSGTSQDDFSVTPFASVGAVSSNAIVDVENKQYFLSSAIYALEEIGELKQIQLGSEISVNIQSEFEKFDKSRLNKAFAIHNEVKNQVWYYFPYLSKEHFSTVWINDYKNKAWYKRVVPQNITCACIFNAEIFIGSDDGIIYKDNVGNNFDGNAIPFMWKSPFLSIVNPHHKKLIDEFYFVIDDEKDNKFKFSVYKDFSGEVSEDSEEIYSIQPDYLMWYGENVPQPINCNWSSETTDGPLWSVNRETLEKTEISGSNYSIQLCIEGDDVTTNCAIIGLEFREIYKDD